MMIRNLQQLKDKNIKVVDKRVVKSINILNAEILKVEEDCILIYDGEWNRRIYFDIDKDKLDNILKNKNNFVGREVKVEYVGDLKDFNNVEFLKIKDL